MGIEKHYKMSLLSISVVFLLLYSDVTGTTSALLLESDTLSNYGTDRIDTVWIHDTVWVNDSNVLKSSKSVSAVNMDAFAHDSSMHLQIETSDITQLNTIIVNAKRPMGKDESAKPLIVDGERIRETSRSSALEELSQESGDIYVTSKGTGLHGVASGASGGIYIRGLGGSPNSQILIVEDGTPDYQGIFGHPIPDAFFPPLIDRVMVVKGGDGVLYGTNAMGGVIVVESRWLDSNGLQFENDLSYGTFNTFCERAALLYKGEKFEAVSAVTAASTDGHRDGTDGNSIVGQIGLRMKLPWHGTVVFRDKLIHLKGGDPGPDIHPYTDHNFEVIRNCFSTRIDYSGTSLHLSIVPWLNIGVHRLYDGFFSRDYTTGGIAECSGELINNKMRLLAGISGEYVDGIVLNRITTIKSPVEGLPSVGFYGQITLKPGFGLTGVCGGRFHQSNRYGMIPLYKAGLIWEPVESVSFHTRLAKNFRQPTLRELYLPFPVSNPDLRPEIATNWDAGTEVNLGNFKISGSLFKTWAIDMIKFFGAWPCGEVVNIDQLQIWGVEGKINFEHLGPFDISVTASWQDVERFTKQNPDAKINGRINYIFDQKNGRLELSVNGEWVHGLYMNNYKRDSITDVLFFDGSIRYRAYGRGCVQFEPYLIIRNLLNSQYQYIQHYPMPGINVLAGLTLKV